MVGRSRWTPPPGWPQPPPGWSPPPGWRPPPDWPEPPPDWRWWPPPPHAALRFHLLGAVLLVLALAGWWLVSAGVSVATASCPPDSGDPAGLHAGVALAGLPAVGVCAWWVGRARGAGRRWWVWAALGGLIATAVAAAAVTVRVAGCPFVF